MPRTKGPSVRNSNDKKEDRRMENVLERMRKNLLAPSEIAKVRNSQDYHMSVKKG